MNYKCQKIPIGKLVTTPMGVVDPLCETCQSQDCTNPIQERGVSIMGVMKKIKLFMGPDPMLVIKCEGYLR